MQKFLTERPSIRGLCKCYVPARDTEMLTV